jgi:hypothetical protein
MRRSLIHGQIINALTKTGQILIKIIKVSVTKLLKFIAFVILTNAILFLGIQLARKDSDRTIKLIKTELQENMDIQKMDEFIEKNEFSCGTNDEGKKSCGLTTRKFDIRAKCKHNISFRIKNNKVVDLNVKNLCAGDSIQPESGSTEEEIAFLKKINKNDQKTS